MSRRPFGVECPDFEDKAFFATVPHGTPLLADGLMVAAWRDASFLSRPDVRTIKACHVVVASHRYAVGGGMAVAAAACSPTQIMANLDIIREATEVSPNGRCRAPGCRALFQLAEQEQHSIEHIRNYYGLAVHGGMRVKCEGRPGTIVGYQGQYIKVLLDGEERPDTRHATWEMEYPPEAHVGPGPDERFAHLVQVKPNEA